MNQGWEKPILLTGANGGIGVALADYLIGMGMRKIILQYRSQSDSLLPILNKYGLSEEAVCVQADLTSEEDVQKLRKSVLKTHGSIWGVINLAGMSSNSMSWKLSLSDFNRVVSSSLVSTFLVCREFIPILRE